MRNIRYYSKNKKAVSAVIGVVLMVAITVAIAATVYFYVSTMINDLDVVHSSYTGEFMGLYEENGSCSMVFIADDGLQRVLRNMMGVSDSEVSYLGFLIGHETTIRYSVINDRLTYEGAYLSG
jgi:flagellin-like protein